MPSNLCLIDTSVWLQVLPTGRNAPGLRERVDALLAADQAVTTGIVRLEVLGGVRTESEYRRLRTLFSALHSLQSVENRWDDAAGLGFELRRKGVTVPFTDLLIASVAINSGVTVVHRDRHFDLIANHLGLAVESYVAVGG
jgi:predicted nucleic acid-binding protein